MAMVTCMTVLYARRLFPSSLFEVTFIHESLSIGERTKPRLLGTPGGSSETPAYRLKVAPDRHHNRLHAVQTYTLFVRWELEVALRRPGTCIPLAGLPSVVDALSDEGVAMHHNVHMDWSSIRCCASSGLR